MTWQERAKKVLYGGDYNPEQWSQDIWEQDIELFRKANINVVTINVFNWAILQPDKDTYDFSLLDKIMNLADENDLKVCLATATAAHPAWLAREYPDVLRTDYYGRKSKFGQRHNSCPNSESYKKYSTLLVEKLVERYNKYDNIVAWHISNEYGGECYCENCEKAFRIWLKTKYLTIENLNKVWGTNFWGHYFHNWDDIVLPNSLSEEFEKNGKRKTCFQPITLDYKKFNSESLLNCFKLEYSIIKNYNKNIPITTNLMGSYKILDYFKWAKEMDIVSWDNYPDYDATHYDISFNHDLMRGIKNGNPFILMEQTPSVSNWHSYCTLKRPNVMKLWSYQAMAHGADAIMFFQMRRSITACEKFHGAVIDHCGHENTRVFREVQELGNELSILGTDILNTKIKTKVAILFDWENWWATDITAGPSELINYLDEVKKYYKAFMELHYNVDLIGVETDLSNYAIVVAPMLYMIKNDFDEKIRCFVSSGGTFLTTYFSGYVDENDKITVGGYPGKLRDILGIWVEEIDALPPNKQNSFSYNGKCYPAYIACDLFHLESAEKLAVYNEDFYSNMPAISKNKFGLGLAYYVATSSNDDFYKDLLSNICFETEVFPISCCNKNIELSLRENDNNKFLFILNHSENEEKFTLDYSGTCMISKKEYLKADTICLKSKEVIILKLKCDLKKQ